MKSPCSVAILASLIALNAAVPLCAQGPLTAEFGGGVSLPVNSTKEHAHNGFAVVTAVGPRISSRLNVHLDFTFEGNNVTVMHNATPVSTVDASMYMWALTLNPEFRFIKKERVGSYVTGGYGLYYRWLQLTRTAFGPTKVCDPWWGICSSNPADLNSFGNGNSIFKGGFNVGIGMTYGERKKFFAETRYHRMMTTGQPTEIIPITFGVRW